MTRADTAAQRLGIPGGVLMERAGVGMAEKILELFPPRRLRGRRALAVCGGGNNGGDGFVIARELRRAGVAVSVIATKDEYSGDPATNLAVLRNLGVEIHGPERLDELLDGAALVVDALLGTGFSGAVREKEATLIRQLNDAGITTVAVDVPSGVNGSTGEVEGEAIRADLTVCAHAAKVGCVVSPGADHAGEVSVVDIGIPPEAEDFEPEASWTDKTSLRGTLPRRAGSSHKYSAGSLLVVAGSASTTGATVMVTKGAQRAGCGIIFVVTAESAAARVDGLVTEALVSGAPEDEDGLMTADAVEHILEQSEKASAIVLGPAAGVGDGGRQLVEGILAGTDLPVLLDADAITNLPGPEDLAGRDGPTVITPHAGELGRLLGTGAKDVSAGRLSSARRAAEGGACVLLKGNDTLVVEGDRFSVNSTGTPALASAGTGDVLSGAIGALLSRGMPPFDAARTGAWAHGHAAELWLEKSGWPLESMTATDLLPYLPRAFTELL